MRSHNKLRVFISLLCAVSVILSVIIINVAAVTPNTVTASTNGTVKQGEGAYCYVYIDSTESLAALDVSVHFDASKVKIYDVYNEVNCIIYDSVINDDSIQFSYIFDGVGDSFETRLFCFYYEVLGDAEIGNAYFDITVGEAYNGALNDVDVRGSQCSFTIGKASVNKTCYVYGTETVTTVVTEEFSIDYYFDTYEIASGSVSIMYDDTFFEIIDVTPCGILEDKIVDVNTDFQGEVCVSFVGTEYSYDTRFLTVKFRTLKNTNANSEIIFSSTELYDLELNPVFCGTHTTAASVIYDKSYVGDAPKMSMDEKYYVDTNKVFVSIFLEEGSRLGAGDFVLGFDSEVLTLSSYEKGFTPTFFNINDKEADKGVLKFSVISLEDIMTAETVLKLVFDVNKDVLKQATDLTISGSMVSDSLTNPIVLNFVNAKIEFCSYGHDIVSHNAKAPTCTEIGWEAYETCSRCDYTTYKEIAALGHDEVAHEAKAPNCTEIGWEAYETCSRCDYTTYVEIPATGHNYGDWTVTTAPTCTTAGAERRDCDNCDHYETREVSAFGHDKVTHDAKPATCTEIGWDAYEACSRCDYTTYVDIAALGHDKVAHEAKSVTCTTIGWEAYETCSRCDYTTYVEIPATGHNYGEWTVTTAPTCTEVGAERRDCANCDHYETREVSALGHDTVAHNAKSATCTEIGWEAYETCSRCDYTTYVEIPATGHNYGDWTVTTAPTCTEVGAERRDCANCDYFEAREVSALGHDEVTHEAKSATCTEISWDAYETCTRCDYTTYVEIPATGHSFGEWTVTTAPSCTEVGAERRDCANCDHYETREVSALGHDKVTHDAKPATCTEIGWDAYEACSRCDYTTYVDIAALGHDKVTHEAKSATCTEIGWEAYETCSRCDYTTYEEIVALGHDKVAHEAKAPTCTEIGWEAYETCSRCDYTTYVEIPATGHNYGDWTVTTAPTCTEVGAERRDCANCDYYETREVSALGHDKVTHDAKSATCTTIGWEAYETCSRCDYTTYVEIPTLGHDFADDFTVDVEATTEAAGQKSRHCTRCDEITDVTEIPKLVENIDTSKIFKDVKPTSWFKGAVDYVVSHGLMNGMTADKFEPNTTMSRAMLVTVLWRLAGEPGTDVKVPFTDLKQAWYKGAVAWAYENGIVTGTSDTKFSPNGDITREQMAAILYRYSEYKGYDTTALADISSYPDAGRVHDYALEAFSWANAEGLITGTTGNDGTVKLAPRASATRAQVATILQRFCQKH